LSWDKRELHEIRKLFRKFNKNAKFTVGVPPGLSLPSASNAAVSWEGSDEN
jgi:hypothetical protein